MQSSQTRLQELFDRWRNGVSTPEETHELVDLLSTGDFAENAEPLLKNAWENTPRDPVFTDQETEEILDRVLGKPVRVVHRINFLKTAWVRYAAAILIIFGLGTIVYLWNTRPVQTDTAKTKPVPVKDILPGGNKALLTLADGSTIVLDSVANGQLAMQGNSKVLKLEDGQLVYDYARHSGVPQANRESLRNKPSYNTMSTPKGGQYQLTLVDGTKVWLNAASSITYPTVFNSNTREVKITGEVYFEVKSIKEKPFIVHLSPAGGSGGALRDRELNKNRRDDEGGLDITVLGTSFNVNAYPDETIKTSLIDGAVKIENKILKPGEAFTNGKIIKTNIQQDIAWKNGYFNLEDITLEQAMRQFARWYDVEIIYENGIPKEELSGKMDRQISLQDALSGLEGVVGHFTLKGRKLYIGPLQ